MKSKLRLLLFLATFGFVSGIAMAADQTCIDTNPDDRWNTTTDLNWDVGVAWTQGNSAIFGETVSLATAITADELTFNSSGYLIQTNTLTLSGTPVVTVTDLADTATINSVIAGTYRLTKAGNGTLTLTNTSNFSSCNFTVSPALPVGYSLDYSTDGFIKRVKAAGFNSWISKTEFGLALADQDPGDDPDEDGVNNLMEYALGRDPTTFQGAAGRKIFARLKITMH